MKRSTKRCIFLLALAALAWPQLALAQKDLQIGKVFDIYGKKKGVVMVELAGEMLGEYNLSLFKSITIKDDPAAGDFIRKCLEKDQEGARKVKQVISSGNLSTVILQLPRKGKLNRLILYNATSSGLKLTLVYFETDDDADNALNLLLKKK
jgi:hypothetical protein